jgi:hypothetical protein
MVRFREKEASASPYKGEAYGNRKSSTLRQTGIRNDVWLTMDVSNVQWKYPNTLHVHQDMTQIDFPHQHLPPAAEIMHRKYNHARGCMSSLKS